jgi:hypothetical protein
MKMFRYLLEAGFFVFIGLTFWRITLWWKNRRQP